MKLEHYACVYAAGFPLQAILRLRTELVSEPVAVMEGHALMETVCALNHLARLKGAVVGMTRMEAESIPGLRLLARSAEMEAAAHAALLECAAHFSPRIEDVSGATACACVLDIAGSERLFGPPASLAAGLRAALAAAGFRVSIATSANFHAALLKASASRGMAVIPPGQEAAALAKLPLSVLRLAEEDAETFAIWGIRTLGEVAALPELDLIARLGPAAARWHALSVGDCSHILQPLEPEFVLQESCDFDSPVEQAEALLFAAARMIDCLIARATARAFGLASLVVYMEMEGGRVYRRPIRPAIPTSDRKFLLKLLQLELAAHPPDAAVLVLKLTAEAGHAGKVQLGLFAPQTPEPSRLDVTIARLKAIAGEDRVGSPVLEDSHRPRSFHLEEFTAGAVSPEPRAALPRLALRRIRPAPAVRVELRGCKPIAFRDHQRRYRVLAAYGPWKANGCWWSAEDWDSEEWDVLAEAGDGSPFACLLVRNHPARADGRSAWQLEAYYD